MINRILRVLDNETTRPILKAFLFLAYRFKGINIRSVAYLSDMRVWQYEVDGVWYLSTGPGWAFSREFLLKQLSELSCHRYLPKPGDVILDIGAGVGEEVIITSSLVGPKGRVIAVEAHPQTFSALKYLVAKNGLTNVELYNIALSNFSGVVRIQNTRNSLANSILPDDKMDGYEVSAKTLDHFFLDLGIERVDFLKMNVEGAEQLIIEGMTTSISKIGHLAISCHDFRSVEEGDKRFATKEKVVKFLNGSGFYLSFQETSEAMKDDFVYATNPSVDEG